MSGARDYARVYREGAILTASPARLVMMLYDGAAKAMAIARKAFDRPRTDLKRIEIINRELLRAQAIFSELRSKLDHEVGGEFSRTMERLYRYYNRRLSEANISKSVEPLVEVQELFSVVRDAWAEMLKGQDARRPTELAALK